MPHGVLAVAAISAAVTIMVIVTLVGNVLVTAAVMHVRKLHSPPNYLLVSLAIADLCVGLFVMPLAGLYEVFGYWKFGHVICNIWVSMDVMLCTASILNLCAVSVDRYLAIRQPLQYAPKRTKNRILLYILIVWLLAFVISVVPLIAFGNKGGQPKHGVCVVNQNIGYQIYATLGAFYIPVIIMLVVNAKIFLAAKRLTDKDRKMSQSSPSIHGTRRSSHAKRTNSSSALNHKTSLHSLHRSDSASSSLHKIKRSITEAVHSRVLQLLPDSILQKHSSYVRETRAARTLSIIMGAFFVCWLPFFVLAVVKPLCGSGCRIPHWLDAWAVWLGYANSAINPGLYAVFNRDFRIPFREMLCLRCGNLQNVMRSETFQEYFGSQANVTTGAAASLGPKTISPSNKDETMNQLKEEMEDEEEEESVIIPLETTGIRRGTFDGATATHPHLPLMLSNIDSESEVSSSLYRSALMDEISECNGQLSGNSVYKITAV